MSGSRTIPRARLDEVERRYLHGEDEREIQRVLAVEFHITRRQVRKYLALVKAKLAEHARAQDPEAARARIEGLLLNAYRRAEEGSAKFGPDARGMVAAAKNLGDLYGVFAPRRHELTGPDGAPIATVARVVLLPPLDADPRPADPVAAEPGAAGEVPRKPGA